MTIGGAALVLAIPTLILPALGFGSAGITAGSIAAYIQSIIGNVSAGSFFALLQSTGALGILPWAASIKLWTLFTGSAIVPPLIIR